MVKISKKIREVKGLKADEFNIPEPGGYEVVVVSANEHINKNGDKSIELSVDIIEEGQYKNYYGKKFERNKEKGWLRDARKYLSLKEENIEYLKGFLDSIEESNGIELNINEDDFDLKQLKGLKVGCQFRLEYYKDKNGKIKKCLSISGFEDIHKIKDLKIPAVKYLDEYIPYDEFIKSKKY